MSFLMWVVVRGSLRVTHPTKLLSYSITITHTDFSNKDILFRAEVFRQKHKGNGNQGCLCP